MWIWPVCLLGIAYQKLSPVSWTSFNRLKNIQVKIHRGLRLGFALECMVNTTWDMSSEQVFDSTSLKTLWTCRQSRAVREWVSTLELLSPYKDFHQNTWRQVKTWNLSCPLKLQPWHKTSQFPGTCSNEREASWKLLTWAVYWVLTCLIQLN